MLGWVAAIVAWCGLVAGVLLAFVPGVSGAMVAFAALCVAACLQGGVPVDALVVAGLCAGAGGLAQAAGAVWATRWVSSSPGAATGAALGAAMLTAAPAPIVPMMGGALGALVGAWTTRSTLRAKLAASIAVVPVMLGAMVADLLATLGVGAVLGVLQVSSGSP